MWYCCAVLCCAVLQCLPRCLPGCVLLAVVRCSLHAMRTLCHAVLVFVRCCRARAELEESLVEEELQRLLGEYVESRVREALASEHVQASLAERLKVCDASETDRRQLLLWSSRAALGHCCNPDAQAGMPYAWCSAAFTLCCVVSHCSHRILYCGGVAAAAALG